MIEETARHRCVGDDGAPSVVVEHRHVFVSQRGDEARLHHGAPWTRLLNGEPVRRIDDRTFEVIATGELLAHDPASCACSPAARIATSGDRPDRSAPGD